MVGTRFFDSANGQHRYRPLSLLIFLMIVMLSLSGCSNGEKTPSKERSNGKKEQRVVAVSYALQFLTSRIAGESIEVDFPAADVDDPKSWSPQIEQMAQIQDSDLVVVNGAGAEYAKWLLRMSLTDSKICKSCERFELDDFITVKDYQIVHSHGPEGEHSHPYFVPYPWLNPEMAIKQSLQIKDSLIQIYPHLETEFNQNYQELKADLDSLSALAKDLDESEDTKAIVISCNPYLKYLTSWLGLTDAHLHWFNPQELEINSAEVIRLAELLKENSSETMLYTSPLPPALRSYVVDELGLKLVLIDTLDNPPADGDFLSVSRDNIEKLLKIKSLGRH